MVAELFGKPLIEVRRGGYLESVHQVAACACNAEGEIKLALGSVDTPVFVRSAVKPMIAATVAAVAAQAGYALESDELALIAASHFGEAEHVAVVERLLARSGSDESHLLCGAARPRHAGQVSTARPIYNNCSGKHAGLLFLCKLLGVSSKQYLLPGHPVNKAWMALASRVYGVDVQAAPQGVDGCGLPIFALSLHTQAQGYARFSTLRGVAESDREAVAAVAQAMMEHPRLVGGAGHLDTKLMAAEPGGLLAKIGAEGVHCSASPAHDFALALKIIDGNERARPPAVVAVLQSLGALSPRALDALAEFIAPPIRNLAGLPVGDIRCIL